MGIALNYILHNPHKVNFFGKTVHDWITGGKVPSKLDYFQEYLRNNKAIIYCDDNGSSLQIGFLKEYRLISNSIKFTEVYLWLLINKINPFKVKVLFDLKKIMPNDILFSMTHTYLDNESNVSQIVSDLECIKIFYISHYMFFTSVIAKNINKNNSITLVAENNLYKNSLFFNKYFPDYLKDVYVLPFTFKKKFKKINPFSERKNKCIATGSFQTINIGDSAFYDMYDYFKEDTFHPMRKKIFFNSSKIVEYIDSYISHIEADTGAALSKLMLPSGNVFTKNVMRIRNYYQSYFVGNYTRRKYYDFDIVKKYNEYSMFVAPEEIVDLPGIGFVEGMACGCAYIGIKSNMYRDIGLIAGTHYVGYENSLDSLLDVIKYYQNHNDELERIAENGYNFVIEHFSREIVAKKFLGDLESFYQENVKNTFKTVDAILHSSFILK